MHTIKDLIEQLTTAPPYQHWEEWLSKNSHLSISDALKKMHPMLRDWMMTTLGMEEQLNAYNAAIESANEACLAARLDADDPYHKALFAADKALDAATNAAWDARVAAIKAVNRAYRISTKPARDIYEATMNPVFAARAAAYQAADQTRDTTIEEARATFVAAVEARFKKRQG